MPLTGSLVSGPRPHDRGRRTAHRCCVAGFSRDSTVRDHLEKSCSHLRRRISIPVAVAAKTLQVPRRPVVQKLFDAVSGTHHGADRHRLRFARPEEEDRSVDVALAMAHHARHQSRRLQTRQPLFGNAGVQTTVGLVDGNRGIHVFGHTWSSRNRCGKEIHERPGARTAQKRHALRVCSNSLKNDTGYQCFCAGKCLCFLLVESAPRRQNIARWLPCIPCLPALPESRPVGGWSLYRKVNSSSWQTTRPMIATMVPTSTK